MIEILYVEKTLWPFYFSVFFGIPGSLIAAFLTVLAFYVLIIAPREDTPIPSYALVGIIKGDSLKDARNRYLNASRAILAEGLRKHRGGFQVLTPTAPMIVLPMKYTEEIKSHPHLSFAKNIEKATSVSLPGATLLPGLGGFKFGVLNVDTFAQVVRMDLTQALSTCRVTDSLCDESKWALKKCFPPSKSWNSVTFYPTAVDLVSRLSARIFLGEEICRNDEWLHVSGAYAVEGVEYSRALRNWPALFKPVVQFFLPERRRLMHHEAVARRVIEKELYRRQLEGGVYDDALQWLQDRRKKSGKQFDIVEAQLAMGLGAIHTTSMALTRALFDLCDHPEWLQPLRDEVVRVLTEDSGWKRTTLHKMKLMDSVLKESQRRNPVHLTIMTRIAEKHVILSDGVRLRKGDMVTVTTMEPMMDPNVFPDPERFIGNRFLKMREVPGNENKWQYVTTSIDHIGFGHGQHACPGRFFAGNELKIALAHMLMLYDWKIADNYSSRNIERAQDIIPDPTVKISFKQREPEMQL